MKCIQCGKDAKKKDRTGGRCPSCQHPFAFEPQADDPCTDPMFENAIQFASAEGAVRWIPENVRHVLCRRLYKKSRRNWWWIALWLSIMPGFFAHGFVVITMVDDLGIGVIEAVALWALVWVSLVLLLRLVVSPRPFARVDRPTFDRLWRRWTEINALPQGLIEPGFAAEAAPPGGVDGELASYSFDRAIVCEKRVIVDLLIANNFHFEHSCAVLSKDGYPEPIFDAVREMLRRNDGLVVYALHDASVSGCQLAHELRRDPSWFHGTSVHVEDLGLRPRHAGIVKGCFEAPRLGGAPLERADLTRRERKWLEKHRASLLALRPVALLNRCHAGFGSDGASGFG